MSIKLYNGYKLSFTDIHKTMKFLRGTQYKFEICRNTILCKNKLLMQKDFAKASEVWLNLHKLQIEIKKTQVREPLLDFSAELTIFPCKDYTLAITFFEHPEYKKLWESLPEVTPYPYWNNSDLPDGVTKDQWAAREVIWGLALRGWKTPATTGLTFTLLPYDLPFLNELRKFKQENSKNK